VNIQNYTPSDDEFLQSHTTHSPVPPAPLKAKDTKGKALVEQDIKIPDNSLEDTIFLLQEEIHEKEALIRQLWKSLKLQKEELAFLKSQEEKELEDFLRVSSENEEESINNKMIKGLEDRIIISENIKAAGYLQYTLDAQVDTGAMNSCAKYGAIPHYYW